MRALLGLLILAGIFALAARWQERRSGQLRDERSFRYGIPAADESLDEGWSTLVLGRPSGADPLPAPLALTARESTREYQGPPLEYGPEYRHTVLKDQFLSTICAQHYGNVKPRLIEAVAAYNDLASPDDIREGQVLLLPDVELLLRD